MAKKSTGAKSKRRSPLQVAYTNLVKKKARQCDGKATAADVAKAKNTYIGRAVKGGKSKADATKIANRVVNKACPS